MEDKWLTTAEAAVVLGVSERTVQRRASSGIYESKTEGGRKYVLLPDDATNTTDDDSTIIEMQREQMELLQERIRSQEGEMERLHGEIERLHKLLENSLTEASDAKERSDTIILTQARRLDEQSRMIEDMRSSSWQRIKKLFHKGASVQPA